MPHINSTPRSLPKTLAGEDAWDRVQFYADSMRCLFKAKVYITVVHFDNNMVVNDDTAQYVCTNATNMCKIKKFDNLFSKLKGWCQKHAQKSHVKAVKCFIATPNRHNRFRGKRVQKYTCMSPENEYCLHISWASEDRPHCKQVRQHEHEAPTSRREGGNN